MDILFANLSNFNLLYHNRTMEKQIGITYDATINGKNHVLTYDTQLKSGYLYKDENEVNHAFNCPLAAYPLNTPIRANGKVYVITRKP